MGVWSASRREPRYGIAQLPPLSDSVWFRDSWRWRFGTPRPWRAHRFSPRRPVVPLADLRKVILPDGPRAQRCHRCSRPCKMVVGGPRVNGETRRKLTLVSNNEREFKRIGATPGELGCRLALHEERRNCGLPVGSPRLCCSGGLLPPSHRRGEPATCAVSGRIVGDFEVAWEAPGRVNGASTGGVRAGLSARRPCRPPRSGT